MRFSRATTIAALYLIFFWHFHTANAQYKGCMVIEKPAHRVKTIRAMSVCDSLEHDMLGLLARAEQGMVNAIKGEHYVPGYHETEVKEFREEEKRKLQARLTGTSFKLKLDETRAWEKTLGAFDREIGKYLTPKKKYRVLAGPDTAISKNNQVISACLRLMDTVYVWTPGCNCPKPKSSALATCAVVLEAAAVGPEGGTVWQKRELLFYVGLVESLEGALSDKRIQQYVRKAFGSFK